MKRNYQENLEVKVMAKILIVDDEEPIAEILQYNLEKEGFSVIIAGDGHEAVKTAFMEFPDLIILDIMLPGKDGFAVCREIRSRMNVPIIMLTARDDEIDKVLGLELGADDYVTKPFSAREVIARVRATLRRVKGQEMGKMDVLKTERIVLNKDQMTVLKDGKLLELTNKEFSLLQYLMQNPGQVFTRSHILDAVWGYDYVGDERTVDVTIRRLRERLEDDPSSPTFILTRRGVGYYFRRE